ncbi:MAG: antibiotic biosynthesis monooxygenase [Aquificae bacterium]|nr:antibiotic biosynthesis monooxygenase [Aquificota bacterium]
MIVVMTKFPVNPEYFEQFKTIVDNFGQKGIKEQKGFIKMEILEPKKLPIPHIPENNTFIIVTYWESLEDFLNYTRSEAFRKAHEKQPPRDIFAGKISIEVYEVIKEETP